MSGTLPTTRGPATLEIASHAPTYVSTTHSLKQQVRSRGAQRWKVSYKYGTMERDDYMALYAFLTSQRGQYDTFTLALPSGISPRGAWTGTPLVNGAVAAGLTSVAVDGLSNSITGIGKAGDYLKFAGHSKVYMLVSDVNSNGSGQATLTIFPKLVAALADNEALTVSSVPFTVALTSDVVALPIRPPVQGSIEFEAMERY
jgi:hypothetical protein